MFGTVHYHFMDIKIRTHRLVSHQYRVWSDCTYAQAGLALYWWQMLITFGSGRIRVNKEPSSHKCLYEGGVSHKVAIDFMALVSDKTVHHSQEQSVYTLINQTARKM